MKKIQNKGFTLVELIIVVTILAILATIAFMSFQGFAWKARDSKKQSELSNISNKIEVQMAQNGIGASSFITVSWTWNISINWWTSEISTWKLNFAVLWGNADDYKNSDYAIAATGSLFQLRTTLEETWEIYTKWNYSPRVNTAYSGSYNTTNKNLTLSNGIWFFKKWDKISDGTNSADITWISSNQAILTISWTISSWNVDIKLAQSESGSLFPN